MSNELKLQAALTEYSSLRAEILQRNTIFNNMITTGVAGIFGILFLTQGSEAVIRLISCLVPVVVILFAWKINVEDTKPKAKRLREIEKYINELLGEKVMTWESTNGIEITGYGHILGNRKK